MTQNMTSNSHKNTTFKLSDQVKKILQEKGFSSLFNYQDYAYFKAKAKNAFNKSVAIAEFFINENNVNSDFDEYVF
jgi:hypothetical protein|tara:strand:- start:5114 stop:5341 length:228 start_codon:yes stop_codon:yes gene_type:complete